YVSSMLPKHHAPNVKRDWNTSRQKIPLSQLDAIPIVPEHGMRVLERDGEQEHHSIVAQNVGSMVVAAATSHSAKMERSTTSRLWVMENAFETRIRLSSP